MLLSKLKRVVQKIKRSDSADSLAALLSKDQFDRVLQRERARSDRSGDTFSLIVFSVGPTADHQRTLEHLAQILMRRLRLTDDAGWLDQRQIGVVLPDTAAAGAWTVADDVCVCVPAGLPLPDCHVYCYPSRPFESDQTSDARSDHDSHRPVRGMERLFARRLPIWKRGLDILGASIGLLIVSPLLIGAAAAIKLTSRGPVFFRQRRSGLAGHEFVMVKFRSMVTDAEARKKELMAMNEQDGPAFKIAHDPRVTRLGQFLRKTSIDELPQLWNVLRGDMSLVGPRPLPCNESEACRGWQRRRLDVTPGLTCIWQIEGRSRVSFAEWVRMDVRYILSRSLWCDMLLLLRTVPAVLFRRGAV